MKKIIFSFLKWLMWKSFQKDMYNFIGYKSIKKLNRDFKKLEEEIRFKDDIPIDPEIRLELTKKFGLEKLLKFFTYKHFLEKWKFIESVQIVNNKLNIT